MDLVEITVELISNHVLFNQLDIYAEWKNILQVK